MTPEDCSPPPDARVVQLMGEAIGKTGAAPRLMGVNWCSDASAFAEGGIPTIVFGPGSVEQAHAAVEYVVLDELRQTVDIYRALTAL